MATDRHAGPGAFGGGPVDAALRHGAGVVLAVWGVLAALSTLPILSILAEPYPWAHSEALDEVARLTGVGARAALAAVSPGLALFAIPVAQYNAVAFGLFVTLPAFAIVNLRPLRLKNASRLVRLWDLLFRSRLVTIFYFLGPLVYFAGLPAYRGPDPDVLLNNFLVSGYLFGLIVPIVTLMIRLESFRRGVATSVIAVLIAELIFFGL